MKTVLAALLALACTTPALAQYYERPRGYEDDRPPAGYDRPPPGYDRGPRSDYDRDRPPPGYDRDRPPPGYDRERRVAFGRHCEVFLRSGYGPQRLVCPIIREKPIGEDCACPTPSEVPGGPPGPYAGGVTVR